MRRAYHLLDVFTDRLFGGNPLAVFPEAQGLSGETMQRIAAELNLSETVFVLPAETERGTHRVRIFTPMMELPFAGHPTVGCAILLTELGSAPADGLMVLEEGTGPVPVRVSREAGRPAFAQLTAAQPPEFRTDVPSPAELAAVLGLDAADVLDGDWAPAAVSAGVPFAIVPVRSREALGRVRLHPAAWETVLKDAWAPHVLVVTPDGDGTDLQARMFAPAMGIGEDPATGAAAAALAGYLARRTSGASGTLRWSVAQGVEMGRPSLLHIESDVEAGRIGPARVGGTAVLVGQGWLEIPDDA